MCCTKGGAGDKDSFALLATGGSSLTEEKCGEVWSGAYQLNQTIQHTVVWYGELHIQPYNTMPDFCKLYLEIHTFVSLPYFVGASVGMRDMNPILPLSLSLKKRHC